MTYVPRGAYKLGEHDTNSFVNDGFAVALLTEEGAEIFAKTAQDNHRIPYNLGVDITEINLPEQGVAVVAACGGRLALGGDDRGDGGDGFSFGVAKNSKGNKG